MKIQRILIQCLFALLMSLTWGALWVTDAQAQEGAALGRAGELHSSVVFKPAQDATVRSSQPTENFGAETTLRVAYLPGGPIPSSFDQSLLQFDLSDLPAQAVIEKAVLHLRQETAAGAEWQLLIAPLGGDWKEDSVTWRTRPALNEAVLPIAFSTPSKDGVDLEVDVTPMVASWINFPSNNPNYGFLIYGNQAGATVGRDFSSREGSAPPLLEVIYALPPIRVCQETVDPCKAVAGAMVHDLDGLRYTTDAEGYLPLSNDIGLNHRLWALSAQFNANQGALHHTSGAPVRVTADSFNPRWGEMRVAVMSVYPLWVQDLDISAQFWVQGDPTRAAWLRDQLIAASDYLYAFTDGQFALGKVTVQQSYDGWDDAQLQLHSSNTFRPRAVIGGVVPTDTPDVDVTIPITYSPGKVFMGSYWNRFGSPPGQENIFNGAPVTQAEMMDDWAQALAHEFGHYLLFLFDTYTGVDGKSDAALAEKCTGTAMGDVYKPGNHGFIFGQAHWDANCNLTEAYARLQGRNEWDTIHVWHPWTVLPAAFVPGPAAPPAQLTSVTFVAPTTPPGPLAAQLINLTYQNGETSSGEARAFLTRGGRIYEQGKPAKNTTQVQLTDAQVGDRLCVYDVDDRADVSDGPRHQFGCEVLASGDDLLTMTKDLTWQPLVQLEQTGPKQVRIVVTQTVAPPSAQMLARIYPEHGVLLGDYLLTNNGGVFTRTIDLAQPVPPLYAQIYVDETPGAPATRREIVVDRGTGGSGAFGPARMYGGVLVQSSDGNALFGNSDDLDLKSGWSIAWQSMPATPPPPFYRRIIGQSHRLDAYPPSLVVSGTVSIQFEDGDGVDGAATGENAPGVFFWDGQQWRALPTTVARPTNATDGVLLASAPSQGVGVYAVLVSGTDGVNGFLPLIRK